MIDREIRNLFRFIPFGKFSLSGRGRFPFNQVFVGRQKERADLIEMLTHQDQFGAFLVSGQRGAGKTSFVSYCLAEYERMAFQRSIRISRNTIVLEALIFLIFALTAGTFVVVVTQALEIFSQNAFEAVLAKGISKKGITQHLGSVSVIWTWVPLVLLSLLMLVPAVYAARTVSAMTGFGDTPVERQAAAFLTTFGLLTVPAALVAAAWLKAAHGSAGNFLDDLRIFAALSDATINHILLAFLWFLIPVMTMGDAAQRIGSQSHVPHWSANALNYFALMAAFLSLGTGTQYSADIVDIGEAVEILDVLPIVLGFWLIHVALLRLIGGLQGAIYAAECHLRWGQKLDWTRFDLITIATRALSVILAVWFGVGSMVGYLADSATEFIYQIHESRWLLAPLLVFCLVALLLSLWNFIESCWKRFRQQDPNADDRLFETPFAPVKTILMTKGNLLVLLTLLGLLPLVRVVASWVYEVYSVGPSDGSLDHFIDILPSISRTHLSLNGLVLLLVAFAIIYSCEYRWICRDLRSYRQDSGLGLLGRAKNQPTYHRAWAHTVSRLARSGIHSKMSKPLRWLFAAFQSDRLPRFQRPGFTNSARVRGAVNPLEDGWEKQGKFETTAETEAINATGYASSTLWTRRREVFRQLEAATLPYSVYSVRFPVLKIWINLGFDNLDHPRIVGAMLRHLRTDYHRRFVSIRSSVGLLNGFVLFVLALFTTSVLSASLFKTGNINAHNRSYIYQFESQEISSRTRFGNTEYCGFFEVYPEIAPVAKSLICALPFENAVMELLYSPILHLHVDFTSVVRVNRHALQPPAEQLKCLERDQNTDGAAGIPDTSHPLSFIRWAECLGRSEDGQINDRTKSLFYGHRARSVGGDVEGESSRRSVVGDSRLVQYLLSSNFGLPKINYAEMDSFISAGDIQRLEAFSPYPASSDGSPTFRVYHLLLYMFVFWALYSINRRMAILPYRSNLDAMDELILLINGRETLRAEDGDVRGWMQSLVPFRRNERIVETENDPRVVEQKFIELLQRLRPYQPARTSPVLDLLEIRPEITFVFDEMDKLTGKPDPRQDPEERARLETEENNRERARARQLYQLLSDMKRLISGNTARFIFIGGRLYHDESLADQAQRTPLLNSIFNGQVYLPSLLADRRHNFGRFNDRITELVTLMYRNARHRLFTWRMHRHSGPFLSLPESYEPTYVQFELPYSGHPRRLAALAHHTGMRVVNHEAKPYSHASETGRIMRQGRVTETTSELDSHEAQHLPMSLGEQETFDQFINFLTYRSAGNPKKLKELIQSLTQPSSYAMALPRYPRDGQRKARWGAVRYSGHDVIAMDDKALYRIQFIDMLYRHLADHMEGRMLERDDKVSISIFYLMDFLMKFHNRGFSRTNLQRVDELSHIHRAPDLQSVMNGLVQVSSERFLHQVLNGVHHFRFRSDFSREIDYLSRISKEEMAALNFTLDESQSLKTLYQQTINTGGRENPDTIAGLGELYEYDQEYEIARNYYRRAIGVMDRVQLDNLFVSARHWTDDEEEDLGHTTEDRTALKQIELLHPMGAMLFAEGELATNLVNSHLHWIVGRMRLMLQIGHTYEQEHNLERANAVYMHAAQLSEKVLNAASETERKPYPLGEIIEDGTSYAADQMFFRNKALSPIFAKTQSIFYQGAMAAAWIKEKDPESIDEGVLYAENWLQRIYEREPLLLKPLRHSEGYSHFPASNGAILIQMALCHNRVGDLYFYKGRQSYAALDIATLATELTQWGNDQEPVQQKRLGYLKRAQYHYAHALWLMRKHLTHRHRISKKTWSVVDENSASFKSSGVHPKHHHATLADVLTNLSESILAQRASMSLSHQLLKGLDSDTEELECLVPLRVVRGYRRYLQALFNARIDKFTDRLIYEDDQSFGQQNEAWGHWMGEKPGWREKLLPTTDALRSEHLPGMSTGEPDASSPNDGTIQPVREWLSNLVNGTLGKSAQPVTPSLTKQHPQKSVLKDFEDLCKADNEEVKKAQTLILSKSIDAGTFRQWIGDKRLGALKKGVASRANETTADGDRHKGLFNELLLKFDPPQEPMQQLYGYFFFGQAAARANEKIGLGTNAANEFLLQAEAMTAALWNARFLRFVVSENTPADDTTLCDQKELRGTFFEEATNTGDSGKEGKHPGCGSDVDKFNIGTLAFGAIQDAIWRIQMTERPSVSRMAQNHGNPYHDIPLKFADGRTSDQCETEGVKSTQCATEDVKSARCETDGKRNSGCETEEEKEANRARDRAENELFTDYDLAQAFRDDPRPITQACRLVLALLEQDCGTLCLSLALTVYKDILLRYAREAFMLPDPKNFTATESKTELRDAIRIAKILMPRKSDTKEPGKSKTEEPGCRGMEEVLASNKDHRREIRNALYNLTTDGLKSTLERFRFPILNRLNGLKTLADAHLLRAWGSEDTKAKGERTVSVEDKANIGRLVRELVSTADLYGAEMHFPTYKIGTTMALTYIFMRRFGLHTLLDDRISDPAQQGDPRYRYYEEPGAKDLDPSAKPLLSDVITTREAVGEFAVNRLKRAQEIISKGTSYYENISYMHYLNDDFNDRSIHFNQATSMANSDTCEVLSLLVREGLIESS